MIVKNFSDLQSLRRLRYGQRTAQLNAAETQNAAICGPVVAVVIDNYRIGPDLVVELIQNIPIRAKAGIQCVEPHCPLLARLIVALRRDQLLLVLRRELRSVELSY